MDDIKPLPRGGEKKLILNVDDQEAGRYAVTRILQNYGYEVLEASSGREALRVVFQEYPDLVVLDVNLPDLNGFEVCKKIKSDNRTSHIPVIHLSATYVETQHRIEGLEEGADGYLVQPVDPRELAANVRAYLRIKDMEETLRESEKRYRMVAEISGQAVYDLSWETGLMEWSGNVEEITGYTAEELRHKKVDDWEELVHPADRSWVVEQKKSVTKNPRWYQNEYRMQKKDGTYIYVEDQGDFLYDKGGSAARLIGSLKDITCRKRAEEKLRASEKKYRSLVQQSAEMIYLHDEEGRIVEINEAAIKRIGYTKEELSNMTVFDLHPDTSQRENIIDQWKNFAVGESIIVEAEHQCKDGSVFPTEVNTGKVEIGGREYILALVRDITERKKFEEQIYDREASLRLLTDHMLDLVSQMDPNGVFKYVSPSHQDVLGYAPEELLGKSFFDFVHPEDMDALMLQGSETR